MDATNPDGSCATIVKALASFASMTIMLLAYDVMGGER